MSRIARAEAVRAAAEQDSAMPKESENIVHALLRDIRAKQDEGTRA
jgi:hypothetical protein